MSGEISQHDKDILATYQDGTVQVSNEFLESLGKEASALYTSHKVPLNEAVVKVASAHKELNTEHVLRVVESANTETYLHYHNLNKTSSATSSYPRFELADPETVINRMNAPEAITEHSLKDYLSGPVQTQQRYGGELKDHKSSDLMESFFKVSHAALHNPDSIAHEIFSLKDKTASAQRTFIQAVEHCDLLYKEAATDFETEVKSHLQDGGRFEDIISSLGSANFSDASISEHLTPVVEGLLRQKLIDAPSMDMSKISFARDVNVEHPLITAFAAMVRADEEMKVASISASSLGESVEEIDAFIRKELL
jgi:hypothetical protein